MKKAIIFETDFSDNFQPTWWERIIQQLEVNRKQVIINLCPNKINRVLDLACGNGELLKMLAKRSKKIIGFDISKKRLSNAKVSLKKHLKKLTLKQIDIDEKLPLTAKSVELVICEASLQYFARPQSVLFEISRILKPKGELILQVPNVSWGLNRIRVLFGKLPKTSSFPGIWDGGALHYFTHAKLKKALETAGFTIEVTSCSGILPQLRLFYPELLAADIIIKAKKK